MEERYDPEQITYAHLAIINLRDGRIAAGARLSTRSIAKDDRVWYEPYAVCSLYYGPGDIRNASTRQAIPVIIRDILRTVRPGTRLLSVKGNVPQFMKSASIGQEASIWTQVYVNVAYKPGIDRSIPELMKLANAAIERGCSVTTNQKPIIKGN
ncbi:hypothetical protein [Paenibacillus caui]|uniref:hypothetical protein n=1 Tax=Paenibacillus caui TaxID=2873927 RepID=UPI001CA92C3C|nr:hypothetical protein [Paenibacillus caui]